MKRKVQEEEIRSQLRKICKVLGYSPEEAQEASKLADVALSLATHMVHQNQNMISELRQHIVSESILKDVHNKLGLSYTDNIKAEAIVEDIYAAIEHNKRSAINMDAVEKEARKWCEDAVHSSVKIRAAVNILRKVSVAEEDYQKFDTAVKLLEVK